MPNLRETCLFRKGHISSHPRKTCFFRRRCASSAGTTSHPKRHTSFERPLPKETSLIRRECDSSAGKHVLSERDKSLSRETRPWELSHRRVLCLILKRLPQPRETRLSRGRHVSYEEDMSLPRENHPRELCLFRERHLF
jgi:hypothetical protein